MSITSEKQYKKPPKIGNIDVPQSTAQNMKLNPSNPVYQRPAAPVSTPDPVASANVLADQLLASEPAKFERFNTETAGKPSITKRMFGEASTLGQAWKDIKGGASALVGDDLTFGQKAKAAGMAPIEFMVGIGNSVMDFGTIVLPRATATSLRMLGDSLDNEDDDGFREFMGQRIEPTAIDKWRNKKGEELSKNAELMLKGLDVAQTERMRELGIDPGDSILTPTNFGYNIGSGISSLAAAAGVAYITRSPAAAGTALGWVEGSSTYNDAKDTFVESGMDTEEAEQNARSLAFLHMGGIAVLEKYGLEMLWKNYTGGSLRNMAIGAITETMQETTQTIYGNGVQKYGYDETQGLFDDVAKTMIVTPLIGFAGGGFSPITGSDADIQQLETRIKSSEAFDIDAAIANGDVDSTVVYADGKSGVLTPEFAEGRINDVAQKIEAFDPKRAEIFRSKVDGNNTTYENIIEQGLKIANDVKVSVDPDQVTIESAGKVPEEDKEKMIEEIAGRNPAFPVEDVAEIVESGIQARQAVINQVAKGDANKGFERSASNLQQDILESIDTRGVDATVDSLVANDGIPVTDRAQAVEIVNAAQANAPDFTADIEAARSEVDASGIQSEIAKSNEIEETRDKITGIKVDAGVKKKLNDNKELSAIIKDAEVNEANALSTIESRITGIMPGADTVRVAELAAEVLDVIQDPKFAPVISEMPLSEVIRQADATSARFQMIPNTSRKPTGKAKFDNVGKEDMAAILQYNNLVRDGKEAKPTLETAVRRLAERYGINPELPPKTLANRFDVRILRSESASKVAEEITSEVDSQVKAKKEAKAEQKKRDADIKKRIPKDFVEQIEKIPLLKELPVQMVDSITTGSGRRAFGQFYMNMVQFVEDADITTIPHESFHAFSQLALSDSERAQMYAEARKVYDREFASDYELEETLAQDFAEWFVAEQTPKSFTEKLIGFFKELKERLMEFVTGDSRSFLEGLYSDVISDLGAARVKKAMGSKMR